jgi:hypothetical protein
MDIYCYEGLECKHGVPFNFCVECYKKHDYLKSCNHIICPHNVIKNKCMLCHRIYIFE